MTSFATLLSARAQLGRPPGGARGVLLVALSILLMFLNAVPAGAATGEVRVDFTFSGTFTPLSIDTNKDGGLAEQVRAEADGRLQGPGLGTLQTVRLTSYAGVVEYGLAAPGDACTDCFRVSDVDFSVEENAYRGPIAHLVRPIRDPVANPSSMPYSAEEWSAFYHVSTGELIFVQVISTEICVESAQHAGSPVPICHVRQHERIVGGTGRFKHATVAVFFTAIAPTYTADAALINQTGCIDLSRKLPSFSIGPFYGAGHLSLTVTD